MRLSAEHLYIYKAKKLAYSCVRIILLRYSGYKLNRNIVSMNVKSKVSINTCTSIPPRNHLKTRFTSQPKQGVPLLLFLDSLQIRQWNMSDQTHENKESSGWSSLPKGLPLIDDKLVFWWPCSAVAIVPVPSSSQSTPQYHNRITSTDIRYGAGNQFAWLYTLLSEMKYLVQPYTRTLCRVEHCTLLRISLTQSICYVQWNLLIS